MKLKNVVLSALCAISTIGGAMAASINDVQTNVIPGEWTSSFSAAKKYAEDNGVPLFILWSNPGCAHCNAVKTACNQADFVNWRKARKYIMVVSEGDGSAKSFVKSLKGSLTGKFPYMGIYWPAGNVSYKFNGYPYNAIWSTGSTTQAKIMNCVDSKLAAWISGGGDAGGGTEVTPTPTPTSAPTPADLSAWKKSRNLLGSYYTSEGVLAGRVLLVAGKVNAKGISRIKASVMGVDGRSKSFGQKSFTVAGTTKGTLSGSVGTYAFVINGSSISGTLTRDGVTYTVKSVKTGGSLADGTFTFKLADYPEKCEGYSLIHGTSYLPLSQSFTSRSSTWSFARKGTLRYVMKSGDFVMSASDNPSGLKLSYKYTNGYFKGAFTVYAMRNEKSIKRYSAKVTGFMVGNSGEGVVTINKVGTFSCTISR